MKGSSPDALHRENRADKAAECCLSARCGSAGWAPLLLCFSSSTEHCSMHESIYSKDQPQMSIFCL